MKNVMLDLETLGTSSNSVIIAIGAVEFDSSGLGKEFYSVIDPSSYKDYPEFKMDADTVMWWMKQDTKARSAFNEKGEYTSKVLSDFSSWLGEDKVVWGNAASFDNVILANAYKTLSLGVPWKFYNEMCYRTLKNLYPSVKLNRVGTHHNALDDAKSQALHCIELLEKVRRE